MLRVAAAAHAAVRRLSSVSGDLAAEPWRINLTGSTRHSGPRGDWWWTGPKPTEAPGYTASSGSLHALPLLNVETASRAELRKNFDNTWALTETLLAGLNGEEAFFRPPYHGLRHPMVFYYGHPAALFVNKMRVAGVLTAPINAEFERVFETGVDEMSWDDMSLAATRWPGLDAVLDYRRRTYEAVANAIETHPDFASLAERKQDSPFWSVVMGIDHERIHIETSSVLLRELPARLVQLPAAWPKVHPSSSRPSARTPKAGRDFPVNDFLRVPTGKATMGKPADWPSFGWDLEYGRSAWEVPAFAASRFKITNGQMHEFVADGGYLRQEHWSQMGWAWRSFRNLRWPTFWTPAGPQGLHEYRLRTIFESVPMQWDWPAEVNLYEAEAFAKWASARTGKSLRLTTELEHVRMRDLDVSTLAKPYRAAEVDHAMRADGPASANFGFRFGSASPVAAYPPSGKGFHDLFGNVWEWCEDHMSPLGGFATHPYYPDFSMPCFDGRHNVITGGSFVSAGDEASVFARFHFRPHFFQHAGFRLVQTDSASPPLTSCTNNPGPYVGNSNPFRTTLGGNIKYDDKVVLQQYLHMHYTAQSDQSVPPALRPSTAFPQRCAAVISSSPRLPAARRGRALDIGCAVGGSAFALAAHFREVLGIDISQTFVDTANELQRHGALRFEVLREGATVDAHEAVVPAGVDRSRVRFQWGDATKLDVAHLGGAFDAVLIGNVLCRLPDPRDLLNVLPALVAKGGLLFISSPFSWSDKFTPRANWLSGAGGSKAALQAALDKDFELVSAADESFCIREHVRKYEFVVAQTGLWIRR